MPAAALAYRLARGIALPAIPLFALGAKGARIGHGGRAGARLARRNGGRAPDLGGAKGGDPNCDANRGFLDRAPIPR